MASPASAAGFSTGFRVSLESARQRRIDEEENRYQRERQRAADTRAESAHEIGLDSARFGLERARTEAAYIDDDRSRQVEAADLSLESARFGLDRQRVGAQREDDAYERVHRSMQSEGLPELFANLAAGTNPDLALSRFNEVGEKKLTALDYDQASGMVRLVDDEGESQSHTLQEWQRVYPTPAAEPIKLGKDDRLVDPGTGRELVGPSAGAGSGRDVSPYNPETVQDDLTAGVVRSMGGEMDAFGRYSLASTEDRQLGDYRISLAHEMEGRLRQQVMAGKLTPGQVVNAVMEATKEVPSETELVKRSEQWRTEPLFNRSHEETAAWIATERTRRRAEAEARLALAEQRILGAAASGRPSAFRTPDWAGDTLPAGLIDPSQLEPGYEYDVDIDGRQTSVRLGPDGTVYEVRGTSSSQAPPNTAGSAANGEAPESTEPTAASSTEPTLPAARRQYRSDVIPLAEDPAMLSPWVSTTGKAVGGAAATFGRHMATPAPEGTQAIAAPAQRVMTALNTDKSPTRRDVEAIADASDEALLFFGFHPEQIKALRETMRIERSLADARSRRIDGHESDDPRVTEPNQYGGL
jgi:hypothetical protein